MQVLLMPANNADQRHVDQAISLIKAHGHSVVRWTPSLSERDFDVAIVIPGEHNEEIMHELWKSYKIDEDLDMDDVDEDDDGNKHVYLGRGLYEFIDKFRKKSIFLMLYPSIRQAPADLVEDYVNNTEVRAAGFMRFDHSDLYRDDETDYVKKYGYISLDGISDTAVYKYHSMSQEMGFDVREVNKFRIVSESHIVINDHDSINTSEVNLLLLRRRVRH